MKVWSLIITRVSDLGGVVMLGIVAFVVIDTIARKVAVSPLFGAYCYVQVALIMVICAPWALVEQQDRQIRIDWLSNRLHGRYLHLLRAITALLSLAVFGLITWQVSIEWLHALSTHQFGFEIRLPMIIPKGELLLAGGVVVAEILRRFLVSVWMLLPSGWHRGSNHS